ncbi:MAG: hypothetical protein GXP49_08655 [Deltaproteobacteria bacterium]|nr:hypothetical protein [Deltaproteobacteria bacterium]
MVDTGGLALLDGSNSSDPDGDVLYYQWEFTAKPVGSKASIADSDLSVAYFQPDMDGDYDVRLTVSDGVFTSTDNVKITSVTGAWTAPTNQPVVANNTSGGWDSDAVLSPCVILDSGVYKMWYTGIDSGGTYRIGYAESGDGVTWNNNILVLDSNSSPGTWDDDGVGYPSVIKEGSTYHMWYAGFDASWGNGVWSIGHATSNDGKNWTVDPANPVLVRSPGAWDRDGVSMPWVEKLNGLYFVYYTGYRNYDLTAVPPDMESDIGLAIATSPSGPYAKQGSLLTDGGGGTWDDYAVLEPNVSILDGGIFVMYYEGWPNQPSSVNAIPVSFIGLAVSTDGFNWYKVNGTGGPVIFPGGDAWKDKHVGGPSYLNLKSSGGSEMIWFHGAGATYQIGLETR